MRNFPPLSFLQLATFPSSVFVHGVTRRFGGVSEAPYDSLNVSFGVGDDEVRVRQNRERIKAALALSCLVSSRQVHEDQVLIVDRKPEKDFEADGYDALITDQPGVGLMIQQADCQAVLLADSRQKAVGVCHVGWRGSVANIIGKTITAMERYFGVDSNDLLAGVSPSLGPCCAEFVNFRQELPETFRSFQPTPEHFDFWSISRMQLRKAGVPPENISVAEICTVCDHDFFSYRRQRNTGRFASVIGISS